MPHLIIEYSRNIAGLDTDALLDAVNAAVCASPAVLDEADLKTRIVGHEAVRIGTAGTPRAFVYAQLRLLAGRSPEAKHDLSRRVAEVLRAHCPPQPGMPVQLSVEVADMDRDSYAKDVLPPAA